MITYVLSRFTILSNPIILSNYYLLLFIFLIDHQISKKKKVDFVAI